MEDIRGQGEPMYSRTGRKGGPHPGEKEAGRRGGGASEGREGCGCNEKRKRESVYDEVSREGSLSSSELRGEKGGEEGGAGEALVAGEEVMVHILLRGTRRGVGRAMKLPGKEMGPSLLS